MNSIQNEHCLKYPYHCFCKESPRFISKHLVNALLKNEPAQDSLKNIDEILQAFRGLRIYTDLETVQLYELANGYAYELAMRTQRVKDLFHEAIKNSCFIENQSDEIWINIKEALAFEHTRYDDSISWSDDPWWSTTPKKTLPEINVPPSETDYLPIKLNMYLPTNELKALLEAYRQNLEKMRDKKLSIKGKDELYTKLSSNIRLIRTGNTMLARCHKFIDKVQKPNTKMLKLSECFFTYDMMEFGIPPNDIARAVEHYRTEMLLSLNSKLVETEGFTKEDAEAMIASVDPMKTIIKWHEEISNIIREGDYKKIVSSNNPALLSTEGYITKHSVRTYYYPE